MRPGTLAPVPEARQLCDRSTRDDAATDGAVTPAVTPQGALSPLAATVLALQRTAGNASVVRSLARTVPGYTSLVHAGIADNGIVTTSGPDPHPRPLPGPAAWGRPATP